MSEEKSDADIMADAREYIEVNGWWRGSLIGPNGKQVCGLGAVAVSQNWLERDAHTPWIIAAEYQPRAHDIVLKVAIAAETEHDFIEWNDHRAKDKQEVLDAFAKAEKIERAGFDPDKGDAW